MAVLIDNKQSNVKISPAAIQQTAQAVLNALDCPEGELSIVVVNDRQIADLNRRYLNREGPTNVIAFPMRDGDFSDITPELLGDVVISVETTEKERISAGITFKERFNQLLVHGILHLFGYDHETNEKEALEMEAKSDALMKTLRALTL